MNTTHNDTPGKAQRYAPPCCNETRPADQRGDYAEKQRELFFAKTVDDLRIKLIELADDIYWGREAGVDVTDECNEREAIREQLEEMMGVN